MSTSVEQHFNTARQFADEVGNSEFTLGTPGNETRYVHRRLWDKPYTRSEYHPDWAPFFPGTGPGLDPSSDERTGWQPSQDQMLNALLFAIGCEVQRARGLHPDPTLLGLAFGEEAGELTKAILEESPENVRKEAIQAAAMAIRLVLDGDPSTDAHRERQGLKKLGERSM